MAVQNIHITYNREGYIMCTAISFNTKDHYFGRNMDYEHSYDESITITPRNYSFKYKMMPESNNHLAMIGMAYVVCDYPLYYDATNEKGLSMAGLNFPGNATYYSAVEGKDNIAPFEFIPWILGQCATISEVENLLSRLNLVDISYNFELPLSPLHWLISDKEKSIVVETMESGMKVYHNPIGVLTNNPPFDYHLWNLCNYMHLSKTPPTNEFSTNLELSAYSRGIGAIGLPGDLSSASRFVKAAFVKENSICKHSEKESVSQFFHILSSVEQQRGCVLVGENQYEKTIYSSCCNTDKGIYYYKTYDNSLITAVDMHKTNLAGEQLIKYPLLLEPTIRWQN